MDHTNTDTTISEVIDGWVKNTETIVTWQEQSDVIAGIIAENATLGISLQVTEDKQASIQAAIDANDAQLTALGYTG